MNAETNAEIKTEMNAEMLAINEQLVIAGVRYQNLAEEARKSAEAAAKSAEVAQRAEQRLGDLIHGLDAVICEVDVPSGRPAFLSLRAETFLGHPLDRWHT